MFKKIWIIFCLFFSYTSVYAICSNNSFQINDVCNNEYCTETSTKIFNTKNVQPYVMKEINYININNFSEWVDSQLEFYSDVKFKNKNFTIDNLCNADWDCDDSEMNLNELYAMKDSFKVKEWPYRNRKKVEYINGYNYFFVNYKAIFKEFSRRGPIPELNTMIPNTLNYKNIEGENTLILKNICSNDDCSISSEKSIRVSSTEAIKIKTGKVEQVIDIVGNNFSFIEHKFSWHDFMAGKPINVKFNFKDTISSSSTCDNLNYNYTISYAYLSETWEEEIKPLLSDSFILNRDLSLPTDTENLWVSVSANNESAFIKIDESVNLTRSWKVNFYFKITNPFWEIIQGKINKLSPVNVIPGAVDINKSIIELVWYDPIEEIRPWDTLIVHAKLKDTFGNVYFNKKDGINVSYWVLWLKPKVKFFDGIKTYIFGWVNITSVNGEDNPLFQFKFQFTEPWYYPQKFQFKIPLYDVNDNFIQYQIVNISQLWEDGTVKKYTVKNAEWEAWDFNISCSRWPIKIKTVCTSDNLSWCDAWYNQSKTFLSEADNGSEWELVIRDFAHNEKVFQYKMNHIDQTAPVATITGLPVNWASEKASDKKLKITLSDKKAWYCDRKIFYSISVNWEKIIDNASTTENNKEIIFDNKEFFKEAWDKSLFIELKDSIWNTNTYSKNYKIIPSKPDYEKTEISYIPSGLKYANNSDTHNYKLIIKDKYWNKLTKNKINLKIDTGNQKNIYYDILNNDSESALKLVAATNTDDNGEISLKVSSVAPWKFTPKFLVSIPNRNDAWSYNGTFTKFHKLVSSWDHQFLKPVTSVIFVSDNWTNWDKNPVIWTKQLYKVELVNTFSWTNPQIENIENWFISSISSHSIEDITKISTNIAELRVDAEADILSSPNVATDNLIVGFTINGKKVRYYLDSISITWEKKETLWVKIIWVQQWNWKWSETGQEENFTDMNKSNLRAKVRKNAFLLTKNLNSWKIINGIKYVEGDYKLTSSDSWYETLIVKNWNVFITENISNIKWIIVLKDNYSFVTPTTLTKWNILITPNVTRISSVIYADGWLMSAKNENSIFHYDSAARTNTLNKQLILRWALFTRNTIWGAVKWNTWKYTLPGGKEIEIYDAAMYYDLNYLRRGNEWCNTDWDSLNGCTWVSEHKEPFVIIYESSIQWTPPKGFK